MRDPRQTEIQFVKGVGAARAAQLKKLEVSTAWDLLTLFPRRYDDLRNPLPIRDAPLGEPVCVRAVVSFPVQSRRAKSNILVSKTMVTDGPGIVHLTFFNNPYIEKTLREGEEYLFVGKLVPDPEGGLMMTAPAVWPAEGNDRLHAVYPQTAGLTSKTIARAVKNALDTFGADLPETLPEPLLKRYRLPGIAEALRMIHFPADDADVTAARRRLIYEELLVLQLGLGLSRSEARGESAYLLQKDTTEAFFARLPFTPTGAQRRSVAECVSDMKGGAPMRRLLQGDVGSGKTVVAAALIDAVAANGWQSVMMVPTEVLAAQHFKTMQRFFEGTGLRVALLTGATRAAARREILVAVASGEISLLIGTHAVIGEKVEFRSLALAITDEQHRFGVRQRAALREKGFAPHVLVMSATPIPRTLSLIVYGDLDISVLDEKPAGRQPVETYAVDSGYRERIRAFLKKQMDAGRQAYVVCPLVEENGEDPDAEAPPGMLAAEAVYEDLRAALPGYAVGLLHGKLKPKEKNAVMAAFSAGELSLLVCTVVIEVGVDVPNANVIVIENAERFGLSQLHQLRGRVGRGDEKAYCILISDARGETAAQRLAVMKRTDDGFRIAEEDLRLRGPGDFFGERQSGLPSLKLADLMSDSKILYAARADAQAILARDPALSEPDCRELRRAAVALFSEIS